MKRGKRSPSRGPALRRLADRVLEAPDLAGLRAALTRELPRALGLDHATLMLWDRRLERFEALSTGDARAHEVQGSAGVEVMEGTEAPRARYLLSEGVLLETAPDGADGVLVPLLARSGLVGMLALGGGRSRRHRPLGTEEVRLLSALAGRAALALENHVYQRELIASERMAALGTMAGMLAHDFRGPMTVIRGYAETMADDPAVQDDLRQRAGIIVRMVDRLERMTAEILDFSRGAGRLARRVVTLLTLLEELAAGFEQELPGLSVVRRFEVNFGVSASVDVDKLRRALANIAANARDAMGGQGRLHFAASLLENGARLKLELTDEGPGVPEDLRESLFDPFVTRGKKGGTGLGLAVSRRFVEDHGGSLELAPGGPGACFAILLPLQPPAEGGIESERATSSEGGN
ncbi:MAG TPA: HAMP domain-containing sensor histidine kinase [Vicinamibacteria bacterium]